jgi:N-carbamoyl-L-amino-acid hydrolase
VARRALGFPVAAYVESHIEQGPLLEAEGKTIGAVTGIQGSRWFAVEVTGEEAHAGTTPLKGRKDALKAALSMVSALEALMEDATDVVRFTVGRFEVSPNSPNTVPGRVFFTVDFRHPDPAVLQRLGDQVAAVCAAHARGCAVAVTPTFDAEPTHFTQDIVAAVGAAAARLGLPHRDIFSGAFHDAKFLAEVAPTGMIFVPCARGISHNPAESATAADLAAGARVLAEVLTELADR